jgi:hypothetical protein
MDKVFFYEFNKKDVPLVVKVVFFPLIVYLFIGTSFLFLITKIEQLIESIGQKTKSQYFKNDFKVIERHRKGIWDTIFFFILFPYLLIRNIVLLITVGFKYIYEYVIETVEVLHKKVIEQVQLIWEQISKMFK